MAKCEKCGYDCGGTGDSAHHCTNTNWIGGVTYPLNTGKGLTDEEIINSIPLHVFRKQADIISTPEDLQADDAAVSALMMESDITAPIKEQCEENARLMRENAKLKHDLIEKNDLLIKTNEQVAVLLESVHAFQGKFDELSAKFNEQNLNYAKLYDTCMKSQGAVVELMKLVNDLRA